MVHGKKGGHLLLVNTNRGMRDPNDSEDELSTVESVRRMRKWQSGNKIGHEDEL